MDDKQINEYFEKIPQEIKDFIYGSNWEQKTKEIAIKYSLNSDQTEYLLDCVFYTLIGLDNIKDLAESLKDGLALSDVLSEQITDELGKRIFENAIRAVKDIAPNNKNNTILPEIRPDNLPTSEITGQSPIKTSIPVYAPKQKVIVDREPIQTPVSVPRFKAVPLSDSEIGVDFIPKLAPKPSAGGIMESKLNNVTAGITETRKETPPSPITKNYSVDPYREPLN